MARLLNRMDFLLFMGERFVNLLDETVRHFLNFFLKTTGLVFRGQLGFLGLFNLLNRFMTGVAD